MTTYAANTSVSVESSKAEIERTLARYGASSFMSGWDQTRAVIGFVIVDRQIRFVLDLPNAAEKRFTHHKRGARTPDAARKEWEQACRQRWRALALVIKAKLEAVESGITTIEDEFLAHIVLPLTGPSPGTGCDHRSKRPTRRVPCRRCWPLEEAKHEPHQPRGDRMRYPTPRQLDEILDQLGYTARGKTAAKDTILEAIRRDKTGTATADGYPSGGERGSGELTSVEAAAATRLAGRPEPDPIRDNLRRFLKHADDAIAARNTARNRINDLAALIAGNIPRPACHILGDAPEVKFGNCGGRLPTELHLSKPVRDFVVSEGRLPSPVEIADYRRVGKWRIRAKQLTRP